MSIGFLITSKGGIMAFVNILDDDGDGFLTLTTKAGGSHAGYFSKGCGFLNTHVDIQIDTDSRTIRVREDANGIRVNGQRMAGLQHPTLTPIFNVVRRINFTRCGDGWLYGDYGRAL